MHTGHMYRRCVLGIPKYVSTAAGGRSSNTVSISRQARVLEYSTAAQCCVGISLYECRSCFPERSNLLSLTGRTSGLPISVTFERRFIEAVKLQLIEACGTWLPAHRIQEQATDLRRLLALEILCDADHNPPSFRARQQNAFPEVEFRLATCNRNLFEVIADLHHFRLVADRLPVGNTLSIWIAMRHEVRPIRGHDV